MKQIKKVFLEGESPTLISYTKDLYFENLAKKLNNPLLQYLSHIGQSLNHFITTENR